MARTLVIKDADFSANKVTTVTFIGGVDCEGISFDQSSYSLTSMDSVVVGYTLAPTDTTDPVRWSSSDENVVTISGGTMTVVGIGTATITATCGNYSASATVAVDIAYVPHYGFLSPTGATSAFIEGGKSLARLASFGTGNQKFTYGVVVTTAGMGTYYPVKLPKNASRIEVKNTNPSAFYNANYSYVVWAKDEFCGDDRFPSACKAMGQTDMYNMRQETTKAFDVPSGAEGFVVVTRMQSNAQDGDDPNTIASNAGLSIRFLTAE